MTFYFPPRRRPVQRGRWLSHGATLESAEQPVPSQTQLHHLINGSVSDSLPNGSGVIKPSSIPRTVITLLLLPSTGSCGHSLKFILSLFHIYAPLRCVSSLIPSGFSKVLKTLSPESTREELLSFLQQYGSHYVSEALYGSELSCSIYFPSKKVQQQLWLQYQKGEPLSQPQKYSL